jgi:putative addiction module component (TIGR02574 family)
MPVNLVEKVLKLPKKEKISLYYTLQNDLDFDDDYLSENDLTREQWTELDRRIKDIDSGKAKLIPWEKVKKQLDAKIKSLRSNSGRKSRR